MCIRDRHETGLGHEPAEQRGVGPQRSRPYLFSNSVAPAVVAGSLAALDLVASSGAARDRLRANTALFRRLMTEAGFVLLGSDEQPHPITPVMFPGEDGARLATRIADHMLGAGVYVVAFSYPCLLYTSRCV